MMQTRATRNTIDANRRVQLHSIQIDIYFVALVSHRVVFIHGDNQQNRFYHLSFSMRKVASLMLTVNQFLLLVKPTSTWQPFDTDLEGYKSLA